MKLSIKQEAFCLAYAASGNATQAYKDAGYKYKTDGAARVGANKLLTNGNIQARLRELAKEKADAKIADAREIQERLTDIVRMMTREEVLITVGCGDGVSEVERHQKSPALKDVIRAAEVLAKMQGAFDNTVKLEMTQPVFSGGESLED